MAESSSGDFPPRLVLLASVFAVAAAGLVYELVAGTLSTYLLGGSVLMFSLVIGWFLSAMGLGAFLAQYVHDELERAFVAAEIALALAGGTSAIVLFVSFAVSSPGYPVAVALVCGIVGALVGLEIPLLLRILEARGTVRVAVSQVLALDYAGALIGSIAFPLLLLPRLGIVRSAAFLGLMNLAVAIATMVWMSDRIPRKRPLIISSVFTGVLLVGVFFTGMQTTTFIEDRLYTDRVIVAESSQYQRIIETGGAEPPQVRRASLLRLNLPSAASTAALTPCQIVGTPVAIVTFSSCMSLRKVSGVMKRCGITCLQPSIDALKGSPQPIA